MLVENRIFESTSPLAPH